MHCRVDIWGSPGRVWAPGALRGVTRFILLLLRLTPAPPALASCDQKGDDRQRHDADPERRGAGHDRNPTCPEPVDLPCAGGSVIWRVAGLQRERLREGSATRHAIDDGPRRRRAMML